MTTQATNDPFDPKAFLKTLTTRPGVYRMLDHAGKVLYVGKAGNLKKRVSSYFQRSVQVPKTQSLVSQIHGIEVTVTRTEGEALLLENNLIKELRPRYNILLRDDKSYPYIFLSDHAYPRLAVHRGAKRARGRYFGPYPNAGAVRESLHLLQKVFRVRQCEDSFFRNRSRPCLQHQIGRCSAPCVGWVDPQDYADDVRHTVLFLEGRSNQVIDELVRRMEAAAERQAYEQAARYRDQIVNLRRVQERQYVSGEGGDLDIVAATVKGGVACVQVFFIRAGRNLGNKAFFPRLPDAASVEEVLTAFLGQFYLGHEIPRELLLSHGLADQAALEEMLTERAGARVALRHRVRGERARWLQLAVTNSEQALEARLGSQSGMRRRREALREALRLDAPPARMECFDISHTQGEATVASCVVFDAEGPLKSDYRRFNITGITPGDDYAAMEQALSRRYTRLKKGEARLPDVLFIDGGPGQTNAAVRVLEELQVPEVLVVGVAKGVERRPGLEVLHIPGQARTVELPADSPALHLVQQIRDEAHRFAIAGHRARRAKSRTRSPLERIPGIGPKRRQQLLKQFGGLQEVARAQVEELASIDGISRALAQQIHDAFRDEQA
jgi:excinuclease ABC subunit C